MDYNNPFGAFNTNYGGAGQQGFVNQTETMETSEKNEMARPFIDMARKNQELDLQKKQTEVGEFNSQEAKMLRAREMVKKSEQVEADIKKISPQLELDLQDIKQKLGLGSLEYANKLLQGQQLASQLKGKPQADFLAAAADWGNAYTVSKQDPLMQAQAYKGFIEDFKNSHPDFAGEKPSVEIPPNLRNWSEDLGKHLLLAKMVGIQTNAHVQKLEEEKLKTDSQERIGKGNNAATIGAASVTAEAGERNNQRTVEGKAQTNDQKYLDHVQTSVDKARANMWQVGLGLPPEEKKQAQEDYIKGVRQDAMDNYQSIINRNGNGPAPVNTGDGIALPASQSDLVDGQPYRTARGPAIWNAKTKKFTPIAKR